MGANTKIEWTNSSWNPIRARNRVAQVGDPGWRTGLPGGKTGWHCEHVSEGCRNCYAESMNRRLGTGLDFKPGHRADVEIFLDEKMLLAPLRWKKPRRIFVNSMTDTFAAFVKDEWIDRMFAVMALASQHTFQVLTKRPERMPEYCNHPDVVTRVKAAIESHGNSLGPDTEDFEFFASIGWQSRLEPCESNCLPPCECVTDADDKRIRLCNYDGPAEGLLRSKCYGRVRFDGPLQWPLPNVWLGVSAEDQATADERIPLLLQTPAAVRFVSLEPLLGPIDLFHIKEVTGLTFNALSRKEGISFRGAGLDWVIVGGESGPHARPLHPRWARDLRDQCAAAGVPFFFKQWGQHRPPTENDLVWRSLGKKAAGRLLDGIEHNGMPA